MTFRKLPVTELGRISEEEFASVEKKPVVAVLDNLRSGHNVGSIFRSADAFALEKLYLCGTTPLPPNREIQKTALGATQTVKWEENSSTLEACQKLKDEGYKLIAIELTEKSTSLETFTDKGEKIALVLGNEVFGVEQEVLNICDEVLEIPQFGTKHSLNVSVSAGIVFYALMV